jgi:predicted nucleic acid-binding protein
MASRKRRTTITLDPAVVEVLGDDEEALSAAVDEVLQREVDRRQRAAALARLLAALAAERGPVEPAEVDDFVRLGAANAVVLDSEAVAALVRGGEQERTVRAALTACSDGGRGGAVVPAAALAELYRGGAHDQALDAFLGAEGGIDVVPTDRPLARRIGKILADTGRGPEDHADASVAAACAAAGGGVILTGDPRKLTELCGGSPAIVVRGIGVKWRPALFGTLSP